LSANPAARITSKCTVYFQLDRIEDAVQQVAGYMAYFGQQMTGDMLLTQLSTQLFGAAGFRGSTSPGRSGSISTASPHRPACPAPGSGPRSRSVSPFPTPTPSGPRFSPA
jgi:hypothetical protein